VKKENITRYSLLRKIEKLRSGRANDSEDKGNMYASNKYK